MNINRVIVTGNLTKDPELRTTSGGTSVCSLRIAVNERMKNSTDEWVDRPNFFDVSVWGKQGEVCAQYLSKGSPVAIDGKLRWREWEIDGGGKRQAVDIDVGPRGSVQFLPSNQQAEPAQQSAERFEPQATQQPVPGTDDDIPF